MADYSIENHGTIFLFRANNEAARTHLEEHTDGTWFGGALGMIAHLKVAPITELSDRARSILGDIYAKTAGGRRNSKAYDAAHEEFERKVEGE
jgi:hypothetical protein